MHPDSLIQATKRSIGYLNRLKPDKIFYYGPHQFTCRQVRDSHNTFLKIISEGHDSDQLNKTIKKHFQVYRAAGRVNNNNVLFTGYYEPILDGALTPDEEFKYPIYKTPDDLIRIDLSLFHKKYREKSITARVEGKRVVPYYSKNQIDCEKALEGRNLEIAWLKNQIDLAFLHIQGSGRLSLPDGKTIAVGYNTSNGRPYRSIGRYMLEKGFITREQISMQTIKRYLNEHPEVLNEVLNHNPSYVFFQVLKTGPLGNIVVPLTPGRSIALDSAIFPKGALGFISCQKPILNTEGDIVEWVNFSRFVFNQDTGGAIKGAGRADIFWGNGHYAETAAGHMQHEGELYILISK